MPPDPPAMPRRTTRKPRKPLTVTLSHAVLYSGVLALLGFTGLWMASDVLGATSARGLVLGPDDTVPLAWFHIFFERGPVERLQWTFLLSATMTAVLCSWQSIQINDWVSARLFAILTPGLILMYSEDRFNVRHWIADHVVALDVASEAATRTVIELGLYGGLGSIMLVAFYLVWQHPTTDRFARGLLVTGYGAYALASAGSATRHIFGWYGVVGGWIVESIPTRVRGAWEHAMEVGMHDYPHGLGYYFMDHAVEESLELLGATLLCALVVRLFPRERPH